MFTYFQPNFMESMVIRGKYMLLLFGNLPNKKMMALWWNGRIQANTFLGSRRNFKKVLYFEILTLESIENPKMCNILKTADRAAKRMKIWDSWSYKLNLWGTYHVRFFEFSLRSFGALCKFPMLRFSRRYCFHSFIHFPSIFTESM